MNKSSIMRVTLTGSATVAAAFALLIYVAHGIAYGSLVGLKGRSVDLDTERLRATMFLLGGLALQIIAWLGTASVLPRRRPLTRWSTMARFVVALVVSLFGTVLVAILYLQVNRLLRLI